jgi:Peptidase S26.
MLSAHAQADLDILAGEITARFSHNYYFMGGDKVENSQDSRYRGLLPDDLIVGKAWLVWKSVDPYSGRFRWERILKKIK